MRTARSCASPLSSAGAVAHMSADGEDWEEPPRPRLPPEPVRQVVAGVLLAGSSGGELWPPASRSRHASSLLSEPDAVDDDFELDEEMIAHADHDLLARRLVSARKALTVRPPRTSMPVFVGRAGGGAWRVLMADAGCTRGWSDVPGEVRRVRGAPSPPRDVH